MNYEFPTIQNISDVLPAIEGRDEFVVAVKEGYTVINYNVMMADTFDCNIRRECRGIIFDTESGDILRRPYHKFFNVNEREETQDNVVDMSGYYTILEKLDGSMIAPFMIWPGEMVWGTKMGATDVAKPVEQFVEDHPNYSQFAKFVINRGYTPIFEWCSRKQRIVLDYKEDQLILTAMRDITTGRYMSRDLMINTADQYFIPVVGQWENTIVEQWHNTVQRGNKTLSSFVNFVRDLEDIEGFVVRFDDGHMLKLKCHWYLQIHKAKEAILQDRNIVELILDGKLDDVKAHLPQEDRDRLTAFEGEFNKAVTAAFAHIMQILYYIDKAGIDRKSYAIKHAPNLNGYVRPIVFKNFDTPFDMSLKIKILDDVRSTIRNNLTKTVKYEAIRDAWFPGVIYNEV